MFIPSVHGKLDPFPRPSLACMLREWGPPVVAAMPLGVPRLTAQCKGVVLKLGPSSHIIR